MGPIMIVVFLGVFAFVALLMVASGAGAAEQAKHVLASLDSALATESAEARDQILNLRKSDSFSAIPWLNLRLRKLQLGPLLHNLLSQANLKWTAGGMLAMSAVGFIFSAYLVYWYFGRSILLALIAGLLLGFALDLMVSALRAGHSLIAAMGLVARECSDPVGPEFKACFEEQNYGLELKTAIDNMINRVPLQDLRIVSTAIMIQKESGGNLAEVLDKTAHVIRERFRLKRQVGVHTAQGRLTGWVLTLLPIVLGVALYFVNPTMMSILWTNPIGIKLLWIASIMIVIGGLIIRKIVNIDI